MKRLAILLVVSLAHTSTVSAQDARIDVHARQVSHRLTRTMTGACLEDVNHEVYGGIYSQMIFGESFREPPPPVPIKGFTAYGGRWTVRDGVVSAAREQGPKLVADEPVFFEGEVGVEVFLPGKSGGPAGLIVKVSEPGVGMDKFIGYEIALDTQRQWLVLGRHRNNWEPIQNVPCPVPSGQWIPLAVKMTETRLEVLVAGKSIVQYEDRVYPLRSGRIGLRPFERECRYRNLWVKTGGRLKAIPFEPLADSSDEVSGMWRPVRRGTARGRFAIVRDGVGSLFHVGVDVVQLLKPSPPDMKETPDPLAQSQRIELAEGQGEIGIENRGLNRWGMYFVEGKPYEGSLWVRADRPTPLFVAMESGDGSKVYAETRLEVRGSGDWQRLDFTLTPNATDSAGRLAIKLREPGSVVLGYAFLQPGPWGRFKGLPVRKDVAEALVAQGLTMLRYGGSMINAPEYRWKKMTGERDRRPPYRGTWYPYSSNGWGILDFLDFCEAAGFLAIPAFNIEETAQDMADFVEYVNGPPESPGGKRRAADGHPAPYGLKLVEIGNEEAINDHYFDRFKAIAQAVWKKDPGVTLVVGDFAYNGRIPDPDHVSGAPHVKDLRIHQKILELAKSAGRPVWFDVHVWNNEPRNPDELGGGIIGLRDFIAALGKVCPGADYRVCVFEENAGNHAMRRALGHAHAINELERTGPMVPIVCAANCLQPYRQNDNGWDQGMLFLTPSQVWGQPPYYVTQMVSRNWLPNCVKTEVQSPAACLDVTAKTSEDGKSLSLGCMSAFAILDS